MDVFKPVQPIYFYIIHIIHTDLSSNKGFVSTIGGKNVDKQFKVNIWFCFRYVDRNVNIGTSEMSIQYTFNMTFWLSGSRSYLAAVYGCFGHFSTSFSCLLWSLVTS